MNDASGGGGPYPTDRGGLPNVSIKGFFWLIPWHIFYDSVNYNRQYLIDGRPSNGNTSACGYTTEKKLNSKKLIDFFLVLFLESFASPGISKFVARLSSHSHPEP